LEDFTRQGCADRAYDNMQERLNRAPQQLLVAPKPPREVVRPSSPSFFNAAAASGGPAASPVFGAPPALPGAAPSRQKTVPVAAAERLAERARAAQRSFVGGGALAQKKAALLEALGTARKVAGSTLTEMLRQARLLWTSKGMRGGVPWPAGGQLGRGVGIVAPP
jgi:hypothetical protein